MSIDPGALEISGELRALVGIGSRLDAMHDSMRRTNQQLALQAGLLTPASTVQPAVGVYSSSLASLVLDLGGPAMGRLWDVRRIVVGGITYATTAAGAATCYVAPTGSVALAAQRNLSDVVDFAATLPNVAFYSAGDVAVRYQEHLFVVITGGTDAQQYSAAARVVDRLESPTTRAVQDVG